jgi:hypothetical protein
MKGSYWARKYALPVDAEHMGCMPTEADECGFCEAAGVNTLCTVEN